MAELASLSCAISAPSVSISKPGDASESRHGKSATCHLLREPLPLFVGFRRVAAARADCRRRPYFQNSRRSVGKPHAPLPPPRAQVATAPPPPTIDQQEERSPSPSLEQAEAGGAPKFEWKSNWYAVHCVDDLDTRRPHALRVLGRPLVLWYHAPSATWQCFLDKCPHRLVPLSEGRIDEKGDLQCSYHGWTFAPGGGCSSIPQAAEGAETRAVSSPRACAVSIPVKIAEGLVFVWPDEFGAERAAATPLPLPAEAYVPGWRTATIVRDLGYGYEMLAENVIDVSHLPFAHHKVGPLDRKQGKPLPLRIVAESPFGFKGEMDDDVFPSEWSGTEFLAPSLYKYERVFQKKEGDPFARHSILQLYLTPSEPGRSRFIIRTCAKNPPSKKLLNFKFPRWWMHFIENDVLDGDSFFLHAQEKTLRREGHHPDDWHKSFFMPTSADRFVVAYRKWLSKHAGGGVEWPRGVEFQDPLHWAPREEVMNRLRDHTQHCKDCREFYAQLKSARLALAGAAFALLALAAVSRGPEVATWGLGAGAVASAAAAWALGGLQRKFEYVGYDHATRD